ncbi:chemotaxis protein CheA [Balneolales bacterium ANBcel1]|nr:chemotaxis protein CheA [Balneolales bacterium ANBcel1]
MNSKFQKQTEDLAEIMRILADVWPGDREDIMVAGARMEDTMEGWEHNSTQLGTLISLSWKALIHLYEKDEYFQSVKSATLHAINTIREYAVTDGDIDVELFEKACDDLEKSMKGESETVASMMDTISEKEAPANSDDSAESADGARQETESDKDRTVQQQDAGNTPEQTEQENGDKATSTTGSTSAEGERNGDEGSRAAGNEPGASEGEVSLDDLASLIMTIESEPSFIEKSQELERLLISCHDTASSKEIQKPLREALNILRASSTEEKNAPDWKSVVSAVSKRIEKSMQEADQAAAAMDAPGDSKPVVEKTENPSTNTGAAGSGGHQPGTGAESPNPLEPPSADLIPELPEEEEGTVGIKEFIIPEDSDMDLMVEFITESTEQIEAAESALLDLETSPDDDELINMVFRSFHTIKGTSAFMGLTPLSEFAHSVETLLDMVRDDVIIYDSACADITLEAIDILKNLLKGVENANAGDRLDIPESYGKLMKVLLSISDFGKKPEDAVKLHDDLGRGDAPGSRDANGAADEWVESRVDDNEQAETASATDDGNGFQADGADGSPAGSGTIPAEASESAGEPAAGPDQEGNTAPPVQNGNGSARPGSNGSSSGAAKAKTTAQKAGVQLPKMDTESTVRVNVNRLDRLIDMVGELVIAHSVVAQDRFINADPELSRKMNHSTKILRELQDTSLTLRMVPLKATFNKMNRLVRDLGKKGSKTVRLTTSGEDTEIDRNMVDIINEPLVHLLRNAIDHGIEEKAEREQSGKPVIATIGLRAFQAGGKVVIEIEDDGRGMNREKILNKAISKGLIEPNKKLTDSEIFKLIFLPGFSTADKVTDLSGRGVGMDVVRRSIEKLQGKVDVASVQGKGTTISLELPFTLAITDGMLIRIGAQRFIVPTINIDMTFRAEERDLFTMLGTREQVMFRGESIPIIRLHQLFNIPNAVESILEGTMLVINNNKKKYALLVDEVIGQQQLVGKSIDMPSKMNSISGGAILGDGQVGLILDTVSLLN